MMGLWWLLVLGGGSLASEAPVPRVTVERPTSLDGRWLFRTGDDPAWAAPDTTGDGWTPIEVARPWGKQGYRGYAGVAWYRQTVQLPPEVGASRAGLGLALGGADWAGYEVYANGHLVGRFGPWAGQGTFAVPHPQFFFIPAGTLSPGRPLVLAVRFRPFPASMQRTPQGGGFDGGLFLIGDALQVQQAVQLAILERRQSQVTELVLALAFFLAGLFHLLFFFRRREQREYLWFGLFATLFAINWYGSGARWWASEWMDYVSLWHLNSFTASILFIPQACFLWTLFGRRMGWFVKGYLGLLALLGIAPVVIPSLTFSLLISTPRVWVSLLFPVLFVALIVAEARRGNREARTIVVGLLISMGCTLNDLLGIRLGFYTTIPLASWGLAAILLSMALSLANRFARVHGELDALNRDLEAKVVERTSVIARQRDELEQKQTELTDNIAYAQRIQQALLPEADDMARIGRGAFVFFRPRDVVSGDFYWVHHTPRGTYLAVADCTGHGVAGAFMSLIGIDLLSRLVVEMPPPGLLLERLDLAVRHALRQTQGQTHGTAAGDGMEVALCYLRHDSTQMTFAGARRPLHVVHLDGTCCEVRGTRRSIGGERQRNDRCFAETTIELSTVRSFYLTSDGFTDQNGEHASRGLGAKGLRELLARLAPLPPSLQAQEMARAFEQHRGKAAQRDDVTVLGVPWQA
ncbi:SpoIIE family protein phosphatase [Chloracidobacterium sp. MS 40/45]|uniref:SpoIIE family protein phosphatase n=1 Tax=Chloracidobacterium aggregatum TaxID=2851959 RepID=UPI001B8DA0A0|nr:SpoIIE family protein phosphatase [Chloracidobacterium aggregatum]QUV99195.1 SpoIIE family protein phosphatase [Chloracidobacterium sp. MS 40/45]